MTNKVYKSILTFGVIASIFQVLVVGYKWQFIPIYIIFLSLIIGISLDIHLENKFLKGSSFLIFVFLLIISSVLIYYLPIPEFTIQNKKYSVGYEEFYVVIDERSQPKEFYELSNLEASGNRELLIDVYYPSTSNTEPIQLFRNADTNWGKTIVKYLNRTWNISLPEFLLSHLNLAYFDIGKDLERLNNNSPVVIYTHGWAGEKIFATDQLITIASEGYVVIALDHTGLSMFTELPSGTIYNTGSTDASSNVYEVMNQMSLDIQDVVNYFKDSDYPADFSDISVIGHSTGGGSGYLYCKNNSCSTLILQDPFFTPLVENNIDIDLNTDSYFIYSEDWYLGYEGDDNLTEMDVLKNYISSSVPFYTYYMTDSRHYDFVAFGAISPLAKYSFLKGSIDYVDSLNVNNYFNLASIKKEIVKETEYLKIIP
tara:strand:- start:142 stop:1422 length:1281 start_codon:yes stop_codon:yes gene_type:complete